MTIQELEELYMCNVFDFYNQVKNMKDLVDLAFLVGGDSMWLIIQNKCHYLFILVVTSQILFLNEIKTHHCIYYWL